MFINTLVLEVVSGDEFYVVCCTFSVVILQKEMKRKKHR